MDNNQKCNFERLQKYCSENNVTLLEDYSNMKNLNGTVVIKGKCNYENCNNSFEKKFSYLLSSNSCFCKQCSKIVKYIKSKKTYLEKYGCNHASQSQDVKNKIITTNLKKYGCKYSTQSDIMKTKSVETILKQYGVKHPMQNKEIKTKTENTKHAHDNGLIKKYTRIVNQYDKEGNFIQQFESIKDAGIKLKLDKSSIGHICAKDRPGSNTCGGFVFKYATQDENVIK